MWWPSPKDLEDLEVEENEGGLSFSAPEDSECSAWLQYFSQTEELRLEFENEINNCLLLYLNQKEQDGETEIQSDEQVGNRKQTEDDLPR